MARGGSEIIRLTPVEDLHEVFFNKNNQLGLGSAGIVFRGMRDGCPVAIKRIPKEKFDEREESSMKNLNHPNVVTFFDLIKDSSFIYIVLELCDTTVENYCQGKYTGKVPPDYQALYQMADGLHYIHSQGFGHRDISTNNVLIKLIGDVAVMKISDFGVCKPSSESGSFSMSGNGVKGTKPFIAPELLRQTENGEIDCSTSNGSQSGIRGHISNDIFSLGCVFYRFLTKDGHPFMEPVLNDYDNITLNILANKQYMELLSEEQSFAKSLIMKMIQPDKDKRPKLDEVKKDLNSHLNI